MKTYLLKRKVTFLLFCLITINLFPQTFVEQTGISLPGVSKSSVAWGDYDNDGDLDILLTGEMGISRIYRNDGNNTFTWQEGIVLTDVRMGSVALGDYDNDGDLDIIMTGTEYGRCLSRIHRNNGDNTFTRLDDISLTDVENSSVAWGDYDNDGDLDILLTGQNYEGKFFTKIYRNNNGNSFTEQKDIALTGVTLGSVAWGDYDNDGDLDILLTGGSGSGDISKIYRNNGDNSFTEQTAIVLIGAWRGSAAWGDYDNDGDLDILITGSGISRIYRNNGNNSFTEQNSIALTGVFDSSVAWGDYDNDGDLDILLTGSETSRIYRNNGDNTFTWQNNIALSGLVAGSVAWGDYDNDGDLDILLTGSGISKIYRNELNTLNIKPSMPSNLQVVTNNNTATFKWDKASDTETPQNGLSYNLYIYENGQTGYKCPPHAFRRSDPKNGKRLIAKVGNIQWTSSGYSLKNLPPDKTYYWSVQAVDAGLQGGSFSIEQSFTMPLYRPYNQADCISFSNLQTTQATVSWVNGGGVKRAVFLKTTSTGTSDPVDNTTYIVNSITPGGWKCVYNGTASSFTLTGLAVNTNYLLHVCEYNGTAGSEKYLKSSAYQNPAPLSIIFTDQNLIALAGVNSGSIAWADYDNDGDLDILITGATENSPFPDNPVSKIYRNNGNNTFTEQTGIFLTGVYQSSVAWGDYDNDGDLDILLTGNNSAHLPVSKCYRNNGNSTFTEQTQIILPGVSNSSVSWSDYDNDGDLDILLTGSSGSGYISEIYRNNHDNSFTKQTNIILPGVYYGSSAWSDYDNDGDADILLTGIDDSGQSISRIFSNNGNNDFIWRNEIVLPGINSGSASWADYDNDGDLDILLTGRDNSNQYISKIYRNIGNNNFNEQISISLPGLNNSSASWGDYDNDGDLDVLLTGNDGSNYISVVYRNNGDNTFSWQTGIPLTGVYYGSVTWGNYDSDSDLDLLLTGSTGLNSVSKIFRNEISYSNIKPSVPTGLQSSWKNDTIIFKWNKSSDNTTPVKALKYNVRMGTSSLGNEIRSGQALPTTGKLLLPDISNLTNDTCIKFKFPLNKYYWSVQAIDQGGMASSFATEQTTSSDSIQTKNLQGFVKSGNSLLIRWKNGNGLRRALFGRLSSLSESAKPLNGTTYHAEPYFGLGDKIGTTGWFCIYDGIADSALIYGIDEGQSYDIQVIEYIKVSGQPVYFRTSGNGNPGVFSTSIFAEQTGIVLPAVAYEFVAWGDYDNDGNLDIILTGESNLGWISKIYRNNGNNTFTEQTGISLKGVRFGSVAWGDYDNDGDLDILLSGSAPIVSKVYRNDGNNSFTEQTGIALTGVHMCSVAWGDYDNDNYLDILLTGNDEGVPDYTPVSKIYKNSGNNSFTEQTQISLPGVGSSSVAWGDYDNDGDLDFLLTGSSSSGNICKIYRNNGDKTFTEQTGVELAGFVSWGDYDNDGDLDFLIGKYIYRNNGNNSFTLQTSLAGAQSGYGSWGDFDNDGDLDIAFSGYYPGSGDFCKVYRNDGTNTFSGQISIKLPPGGYYSSPAAWGDYDNDGDLDLLIGYKVYSNNTFMKAGIYQANKKPPAPVNLLVTPQPSGTRLTWSPVKTDETPYKTMTYNVRISSTRVGSDICSPQADPVNGYRHIAATGNAQLDTTFLIKNLLSSTKFYWSVQAVDQGYAGGAWSAVDSFIVKNTQAFFKTDTVCQGLPTHFTDQSVATDGIASWKWNFKDGTTSSLQNPVHTFAASGMFNVKLVITSSGGVKDSLEKNIVIKPKPNTDFSASTACQGTETLLTNLTNTSGLSITSWSWDYGDGKGSTFQNPGSHGYLSAGDYQLTLTANADNKCSGTIMKTVSVGAYPVAAITANAPLSFCAGDSVILSVGSNPQYSYKWMLNNTGITNAVANNYTAKLSGNYSVEVTNTKGLCKTSSSQVAVTRLGMPATPVIVTQNYQAGQCPGENQIILSVDQPVIEYSYQWKRNGTPITNANGGSHIDILTAGDYSVTANLSGCRTESAIKTITYENAPPKPLIYIHGPNVWYLACSIANAVEYKYRWYYNGILIPEADKYIYVANKNLGNYYVTIENSKGCYNSSDVIKIPTGNISIEETDPFAGLKIYPNPSSGKFVVEIDNQSYGEFAISVLAQGGRQVLSTKFEKTTEHFSSQIDMNGQAKGIYIINFKTDKDLVTRKLVVE